MLKNLKKLNRADLREIKGGGGAEKCDIGPVGCPCKIPPGDPCLGGGGDPGNPGTCRILSGQWTVYLLYRSLSKRITAALCIVTIKRKPSKLKAFFCF
jgi:hypothetical protein